MVVHDRQPAQSEFVPGDRSDRSSNLRSQQAKAWQLPGLEGLELFCANRLRHHYGRHSHAGYALGVIESGVGGNFYRGATHFVPAQSIVLMDPDEVHTGYAAADLPLTYRMFYPSVELMQQLALEQGMRGTPSFRSPVIDHPDFAAMLQQLHQDLERSPEQSPPQLEQQTRLLEVLSMAIARYTDCPNQSPKLGKEQRIIQCIKEYLHDHLSGTISLNDLTQLTQLNRSYLIRLFRSAVGLPPYLYLTQLRIEKAKQLLRQGNPVAEVAIAVGMSDQSHLTRHFKRIVGVTPGSYRQMSLSFKTR